MADQNQPKPQPVQSARDEKKDYDARQHLGYILAEYRRMKAR